MNNWTKEDASRLQNKAATTGHNQELARIAQSAADKHQSEKR